MRLAPVSYVGAARESSVICAALLGWVVLREGFGAAPPACRHCHFPGSRLHGPGPLAADATAELAARVAGAASSAPRRQGLLRELGGRRRQSSGAGRSRRMGNRRRRRKRNGNVEGLLGSSPLTTSRCWASAWNFWMIRIGHSRWRCTAARSATSTRPAFRGPASVFAATTASWIA